MALVRISIAEATNKQLLYFAQTVLNIDVKSGANSSTLIAKIEQAQPGIEFIQAPEAQPMDVQEPSPDSSASDVVQSNIPEGLAGMHSKYDPKVTLEIATTQDPTKPKRVHIAVRGEIVEIKRGVKVELPYRYYLALADALEMVARDTDEINPATGMPIREYVEVPSYPHQVWARPSDEEIAAWHERTDNLAMA